MKNYDPEINMYFELKGTPDSSKESYLRRMKSFIKYMEDHQKVIEDITFTDIQQYILLEKRKKSFS